MDKNKILFITSNMSAGGIQNVISNLSKRLSGEYDISLLLDYTDDMFFDFTGEIISLGMKPPKSYNNLVYQFRVLIKRVRKLKKIRKSGEYKVIVSAKDSAHLANILTKRYGGKTVMAIYNNIKSGASANLPSYKYIMIPVAKRIYKKSDIVVTISEGVKELMSTELHVPSEKLRVIYEGIDVESIEQEMSEPLKDGFAEGKRLITALGRLSPVKGYKYLINAIDIVKDSIPNVYLVIMGTGNIYDDLQREIDSLGINEYVKLNGFTKNPYNIIANSEIFAMSSITEGFGLVLLEAMVCGTPIVSTDYDSGAREILEPKNFEAIGDINDLKYAEYGLLVPPFKVSEASDGKHTYEEQKMAQAIIELLNDEEKRMDYKKKYKDHKSELSLDRCIEQWKDLLAELCG